MLCQEGSGEDEIVDFIVVILRACWIFFLVFYVALSGKAYCLGEYIQ